MKRALFVVSTSLFFGGAALAQEPAPEAAPAPPPEPEAPPPPPAAPMEPAAPVTAPAEMPTADQPPETTPAVQVAVFADSYYNWQTDPVGTTQPFHGAYSRTNGFGLSFFGADLVYDAGQFAVTGSLRFGPSVPIFYAADTGPFGIDNIIQAYATWRPVESLSIDFGQFGTIYGAEVAESWRNVNYTRGALYYAMQPFWHTGVRAKYTLSDSFALTGMVVNGVNNILENGDGYPSLGLQAAFASDVFALTAGYLGSLDRENEVFDHFVDVVGVLTLGDFKLIFNGDFNIDQKRTDDMGAALDDINFWGLSLAAAYDFSKNFGVALRGEYLNDTDNALYGVMGAEDVKVTTGTLTLSYYPFESRNVIIRWDNRIESASEEIFVDRDSMGTKTWFQTVLGFVVTSAL